MNDTADALRQRLIRNFDEVPGTRDVRAPLYDSVGARLGQGTAARKQPFQGHICRETEMSSTARLP